MFAVKCFVPLIRVARLRIIKSQEGCGEAYAARRHSTALCLVACLTHCCNYAVEGGRLSLILCCYANRKAACHKQEVERRCDIRGHFYHARWNIYACAGLKIAIKTL